MTRTIRMPPARASRGVLRERLAHALACIVELETARDEARYAATILCHAYRHDSRPPPTALAIVETWEKEPQHAERLGLALARAHRHDRKKEPQDADQA